MIVSLQTVVVRDDPALPRRIAPLDVVSNTKPHTFAPNGGECQRIVADGKVAVFCGLSRVMRIAANSGE